MRPPLHTVLLVIHLVLALVLIGVVLLQRSEGGGLAGGGGNMSGRPPLTALGKVTWALAIAFLCTSLGLTIIAARESADASVLDRLSAAPAPVEPAAPVTPLSDASGEALLPTAPESTDLVPTLD